MLRSISNNATNINTDYDKQQFDDQSQYRNQVMQGAGQAASMGQYQPSTFATLASPVMQGMGMSLGPKMGNAMADWAGKGWNTALQGFNSLSGPAASGTSDILANVAPGIASGIGAGEQAMGMGFDSIFNMDTPFNFDFGNVYGL